MEEIIAKSKQYKAEKARQKEADQKLLDDLDRQYRELLGGGGLSQLLLAAGEAR